MNCAKCCSELDVALHPPHAVATHSSDALWTLTHQNSFLTLAVAVAAPSLCFLLYCFREDDNSRRPSLKQRFSQLQQIVGRRNRDLFLKMPFHCGQIVPKSILLTTVSSNESTSVVDSSASTFFYWQFCFNIDEHCAGCKPA